MAFAQCLRLISCVYPVDVYYTETTVYLTPNFEVKTHKATSPNTYKIHGL